MKIAIIGLGLIGGSLAKDLKRQMNLTVFGVEKNKHHQQMALELDLIDGLITIDDLHNVDIIILSTPVDTIESLLPQLLDNVNQNQVVIDVGSTKARICDSVVNHPNRGRYVAAHPLAGTEYSGPQAALSLLFVDKKNIICNQERTDSDALEIAKALFESVGMNNVYMPAEEHDKHLAYVSHLSHVSSFMLGMTVLDIEKDEKQILNLASTGFASTVRLAKSNPKTWSAIFSKNKEHLGVALDSYIKYLQAFKTAIEEDNIDEAMALMEEANKIKKILD